MEHSLAQDLDHVLTHTESLWPEASGARFFFTGGTGFVGKWLLESLLWANRRLKLRVSVTLLTRNPEAFAGSHPHLAKDPAVALWPGDAAGFAYPEGTFPFLVHAATERPFDPDRERPAGIFDCNLNGTRYVLEMARSRGGQRLLFTSSGAVYGRQPWDLRRVPEEYAGAPDPTDLHAAYGHSKRASEFLCACYSQVFGLETKIARLFAFVGPYLPLDEHFAVGNFLRDALAGGPIRIAGDGTPYRSYQYAADMAIWLWTIFFHGRTARAYNVGSAEDLNIAALARRVVAVTGVPAEIRIARQAVAGVPAARYVPSTERAENELELRNWISLDEGIRRTYEWHRGQAPGQAPRQG